MQVIYADTLFIINFVVNYLILLAVTKICAITVKRIRLAGAAALGGFYAVAAALPPLSFLHSPTAVAAAGLLLVLTAFGGQERIARIAIVFFAISAAFAGAALAVSMLLGGGTAGYFSPISIKTLVLTFAVAYAVMSVVFRGSAGNKGAIVALTVRQGGGEIKLRALVDTGNTLRDPMTGLPVVVTGVNDLKALLPKELRGTVCELGNKGAVTVLEELCKLPGDMRFQLVPYSAVGVSEGMLLAFKPDEVVVDGNKKTGMLVALSPNGISDNGTYSALIGA